MHCRLHSKKALNRITIAAFALAALGAAVPAEMAAQQAPRQLYLVVSNEMSLANGQAYATEMSALVDAATKAQVPHGGWTTFRDGPRFTIMYPIRNMAHLDDPQWFVAPYRGTAAEAALASSMANRRRLAMSTSSEILEYVPELSYRPAQVGTESVVRVSHVMLNPDRGADYDALITDANAVRAAVGYPYRVDVYRTLVGQGRRYVVVNYYDTREAFVGANSIGRLLQSNADAQARWSVLAERNTAAVHSSSYRDMNIAAPLSYRPQ
jgi:hypothetical protein